MNRRIRILYTMFLSWMMFAMNTGLLWAATAAEKEKEKPPEWILSYAFAGMLIGLALLAIIRTSKRKDSIISEYDRKRMDEEELKKAQEKH